MSTATVRGRYRPVGIGVAAAISLLISGICPDAVADDFLERLAEADRLVRHVYLEADVVIPPPALAPETPHLRETIRYTRDGDFHALQFDFLELISDTNGGTSGPGAARHSILFPLRQYFFADEELRGMQETLALDYSKSGAPIADGRSRTSRKMYRSDDGTLVKFLFIPQWLTGRGYSDFLLNLEVSEEQSQTVEGTGDGFFTPTVMGTWRLSIDSATLLVREASFSFKGSRKPVFRMSTEGLLTVDAITWASVGKFIEAHGSREFVSEFRHTLIKNNTDDDFFGEVRKVFRDELPVRSVIVDARGEEVVATRVGSAERGSGDTQPAAPSRVRIFIFVQLMILCLLTIVYVLRDRRGHSMDKPPAAMKVPDKSDSTDD